MSYFKPWRRKFGVLTLLMACVFAFGWIRSLTKFDSVMISETPEHIRQIFSHRSNLGLEKQWESAGELKIFRKRFWSEKASDYDPLSDIQPNGDWAFCGLRLCDGTDQVIRERVIFLLVPYCWIVIPLAAISAWLLLSKPSTLAAKVQA